MSRSFVLALGCAVATCKASPSASVGLPPAPPNYVLLEPAGAARGELAVVRTLPADHPRRAELDRVLARPYLRWVLALGEDAKRRAHVQQPAYFVIVKGGNRPHQGLVVDGVEHRDAWYVEIDPDHAATLVPHEYGHVLQWMLLAGLPEEPQLLPHTTGAITNRGTALSEGWGIHFETIAADHRDADPAVYAARHRDAFTVDGDLATRDSFLPITDLFTYSQDYRRYSCIKDNCFAYLPRLVETSTPALPDAILARYTDTTYDPARVKSLEQMVASEGVLATLFYRLATGPSAGTTEPPLPDPARYAAMFDAFTHITEERATTTPPILIFLEALLTAARPTDRLALARIAMDVFHYTLATRDAPAIYAELHALGHRLDKDLYKRRLADVSAQFDAATHHLADHPDILRTLAAPQIWLTNDTLRLDVPKLGISHRALTFDLNAAPIEFLLTIPGVTPAEAELIDRARRAKILRTVDDFASIAGIHPATATVIRGMHARFKRTP